MAIINLLPDADGDIQQWTPNIGAPHWTMVDDPVGTPDEDATYVYSIIDAEVEDFNHQDFPYVGATISNVRLLARARKLSAGNNVAIDLGLKIAGIRYPAGVSYPVTTTYDDYTFDWATNPSGAGAAPWTKGDIDSLQSSIQSIIVAGISPQLRCTQVYLIVTYTLVTPVAGSGLVGWTP